VDSNEAVLRIASYAQRKENLGQFVTELANGRLLSLLQKADKLDMWDEVEVIFLHLPLTQ